MTTACFRDVTEAVARKARRAKGSKKPCGDSTDSTHQPGSGIAEQTSSQQLARDVFEATSPAHHQLETRLSLTHLSVAIEDVATNYMLSFYTPMTAFAYLASSEGSYTATTLLPPSILLAPALALLSQESQQPSVLDHARRHYVKAVNITSAALSSPTTAKADTTLLAVLLLALYEATVFRGRESPTGWTAHATGSAALLELRGKEQLETPLGRQLFIHASAGIRTSCLQRDLPVPPVLAALQALIPPDSSEARDPALSLMLVLDELGELLDGIRREKHGDPSYYLRAALDLDERIAVMMDDMRGIWPYDIVQDQRYADTGLAPSFSPHSYSTPRSARFWNLVRMVRVILNGWFTVVPSRPVDIPEDDASISIKKHNAVDLSENLSWDILASVPYLLDKTVHRSVTISARWLIWPLSCVAMCPSASNLVVREARRRLALLGSDLGIVQASEALKMAEEKTTVEDWLHLYLL